MKITSVTYGQLKNTGNFENVRAEVSIELGPDDTPESAWEQAKKWVETQLRTIPVKETRR